MGSSIKEEINMNDAAKIYGLCLERLKYQITNAKKRINGGHIGCISLECYNTGDIDDIIDILELYDVQDRTIESVKEKLEELAYTVSVLSKENLFFGFNEKGYLILYLGLKEAPVEPLNEILTAVSAV